MVSRGSCVRSPYLTLMIRRYLQMPQIRRRRYIKTSRKMAVQGVLQAPTLITQTRKEMEMIVECGLSSWEDIICYTELTESFLQLVFLTYFPSLSLAYTWCMTPSMSFSSQELSVLLGKSNMSRKFKRSTKLTSNITTWDTISKIAKRVFTRETTCQLKSHALTHTNLCT